MGDPNAAVRGAVRAFLFHPGSDSRIDGGLSGFQHHLRRRAASGLSRGQSCDASGGRGDVADPAGHGEGVSFAWDGDARTVQRTAGGLGTDGVHRRRFLPQRAVRGAGRAGGAPDLWHGAILRRQKAASGHKGVPPPYGCSDAAGEFFTAPISGRFPRSSPISGGSGRKPNSAPPEERSRSAPCPSSPWR